MTDAAPPVPCDRATCPGHKPSDCPAHKKQARGGGPCTARAGAGTDHKGDGLCKWHGGGSPRAAAASKTRQQRQAAEDAVATYGLPREIDPTDALLEEIHRTAGHVDYIAAQLRDLDAADIVWGLTERQDIEASEFPGTNVKHAAAVNVWVDLYQKERKHLVDVCKAAIGAGIEERRVKLAERQGELAGQALRHILAGLALTATQKSLVPQLVRTHLALPVPSPN
jgi:hypothetical protein